MMQARNHPQTADVGEFPLLAVDVCHAGADVYAALHAFATQLDAERFPDDPPIPLDDLAGLDTHRPSVKAAGHNTGHVQDQSGGSVDGTKGG